MRKLKFWPLLSQQERGDIARDRKDWTRAIHHYRRHLRATADDAAIWIQLGHAYKEHGSHASAALSYQRALYLRPYDADLHLQIGHLHQLRKELPLAIAAFRRALELDPALSAANEALGQMEWTVANYTSKEFRITMLERQVARLERRLMLIEQPNSTQWPIRWSTEK